MIGLCGRSIVALILIPSYGLAFTWRLLPFWSRRTELTRSTGLNTMDIPSLSTPSEDDGSTLMSLAAGYLVECRKSSNKAIMTLRELSDITVDESYSHSEGASAWACLHGWFAPASSNTLAEPRAFIIADFATRPPSITVTNGQQDLAKLTHVLSRVLAQWSLPQFHGHDEIDLPDGSIYSLGDNSTAHIHDLFQSHGEIVEMVDRNGAVIARIPRLLVHEHNILHRGVGLFITDCAKEQSYDDPATRWYVHRRSSTKRIFPSLYDMFVGGVAVAGEDNKATALREVQEELGLTRGRLSDPLLTCTVCTEFNRCFVTLFAYQINPQDELIRWQEDEVAWGAFCSYPVIQAAADRSIQRLVKERKWPGQLPPTQSELKGSLDGDAVMIGCDAMSNWTGWDFVPDGLLVWEAWLEHRRLTTSSSQL